LQDPRSFQLPGFLIYSRIANLNSRINFLYAPMGGKVEAMTLIRLVQAFCALIWRLRELLSYGAFSFTTVWGLQRLSCGQKHSGFMIALSIFGMFCVYLVLRHEQHKDDVRKVFKDQILTAQKELRQLTTDYRRVQLHGMITAVLITWAFP